MPRKTKYYKCVCGSENEFKNTQMVCDCNRTYWSFTDEKGTYAMLVYHPDKLILDKEFDTKILTYEKC